MAIIGQNARESEEISTPIRHEAIFQDTLSPGTSPNFPSLLGPSQDDSEINDTQNQGRVRTTYGSRISSNVSQNAQQNITTQPNRHRSTTSRNTNIQRKPNPLRQQQNVLPPLPMNMWNDARAEQAMKGLLQMAKDVGWENSLYRNRGNWCKDIKEDVFREGGPFYGYRPCAAIGIQDRIRNIVPVCVLMCRSKSSFHCNDFLIS